MIGAALRLGALLVVGGLVFTSQALQADARRPAYGALLSQLNRSAVPIFLPARLPTSIGPLPSIAVITSGRDGYYVGFSAVPNCSGALSCAILHVAGFARGSRPARAYGHDRPVRLPDRSRGFYAAPNCSGSSCTEASLTFERAGAVYEIDANVGKDPLPVLIAVYRELRCFERRPTECHGR